MSIYYFSYYSNKIVPPYIIFYIPFLYQTFLLFFILFIEIILFTDIMEKE